MTAPRRAFTLVELLVVITIIGMLFAMTFPAFQGVLASVRRQECANKLRELVHAAAVGQQASDDRYPALVEKGRRLPNNQRGEPVAWAAGLLPYLGHKPLGDTWTSPRPNRAYVVARVSSLICSEDDTATGDQPLSYVINAGAIEDAVAPNAANGIAFSSYLPKGGGVSRSAIDAQKSLDATILFSENLQAGNWADARQRAADAPLAYDGPLQSSAREAQRFTGFVWNGLHINEGDATTDFDRPPTAPDARWARPSSHHPAGVNIALCGGGVRLLHQTIERHVFQYLCVTNPAKAAAKGLDPGVAAMLAPGDF